MAKFGLEDAANLNGGGGKYFKVNADESKVVRFLWNKWEEVNDCAYRVHSIRTVRQDGSTAYSTISCPKQEDLDAPCDYCEGNGIPKDNAVGRVCIPLYNVDDGRIQYWLRSADWVTKTLKPILEELSDLPSLAMARVKIKRTGTGLDTTYTPIVIGSDTGTDINKDKFGEVEDPFKVGMIKRYGEENNTKQVQQAQQPVTNYAPRSTTDMF